MRRLARAMLPLLAIVAGLNAEASLTRESAAERAIEAPVLTLSAAAPEPPEFSLFEGTELTVAAAESERAPSFHPLAAVSLLSKDGAEGPLVSVDELSYPKTRYRVFGLLGTPILGELRGVSLELHWRSASLSAGLASGTVGWLSEDPLDDVDSPNLYGFVSMRPHEKTDPLGLAADSELPRIMELIQAAGEEAARRHGLTSLAEVEKHGELGTPVHKTMQELLSPGGAYHHPRILTEVEVGPGGRVLNFGSRGFAQSGSMVKDVVILREGVSPAAIRLGTTEAKAVTQLVIDLKTGIRGAAMREGATLARFGVTNVKLKPFQSIFEQRAKSVKMLERLERIKPLAKLVPVLGALVTGLTIADAKEALNAGDPERAAKVMMGLDVVEDSTKALANETERRLKTWEDRIGLSRDSKTKTADDLEK